MSDLFIMWTAAFPSSSTDRLWQVVSDSTGHGASVNTSRTAKLQCLNRSHVKKLLILLQLETPREQIYLGNCQRETSWVPHRATARLCGAVDTCLSSSLNLNMWASEKELFWKTLVNSEKRWSVCVSCTAFNEHYHKATFFFSSTAINQLPSS